MYYCMKYKINVYEYKMKLELDPVYLLLCLPSVCVLDVYQKKVCNVMVFCARKTVLQHWI